MACLSLVGRRSFQLFQIELLVLVRALYFASRYGRSFSQLLHATLHTLYKQRQHPWNHVKKIFRMDQCLIRIIVRNSGAWRDFTVGLLLQGNDAVKASYALFCVFLLV